MLHSAYVRVVANESHNQYSEDNGFKLYGQMNVRSTLFADKISRT